MLILKAHFKSSVVFLPKMKIGEVARKAGIRTSAIRFYEKAGVLPLAARQNGQRHFAPDAELQLAVIEFARKAGFTIAEIKLLFHGFRKTAPASARWRQLARKKYREMDLLITRLKSMQKLLKKSMRCHCTKLDDCGRILLSQSENATVLRLPLSDPHRSFRPVNIPELEIADLAAAHGRVKRERHR